MKRLILSAVAGLLVLTQSASAESIQYYLERVAIHARLVQSKLPEQSEPVGGSALLRFELNSLLEEVDQWKASPGGRELAGEVRGGLDEYRRLLTASASGAGLDANQNAALSLLLLELEQASRAIAGGLEKDTLGNLGLQPVRSSEVGLWGAFGPWGGFAGPWGPGCDPWGPYFGRPLNTGACPYYW